MKFRTLMTIKAVVCLVFGILLLFVPGWLLTLLGGTYGPGAAFTGRLYGASLIGNLVLTWMARDAEPSVARRAIVWDLFLYDGIGLIVTLAILLSGGLGTLSWAIVAVFLFLTIGFGYFALKEPKSG